jgi:hypothetical protein
MATSFFVVDQTKLVKGAGRLMIADSTQTKPTQISDVINTTTYAAQTGWTDLGATREGIQVTVNNTETGFDVDQVAGLLLTTPENWECSVVTNLAEVTLEHMVIAWEGAAVTTGTNPSENVTGFAGATSYTERRLAVIFKKPASSSPQELIAFFFWRAVRAPQEGTLNFQKGGDAMVIPVRFNILADTTQTDPLTAFFAVHEQQG